MSPRLDQERQDRLEPKRIKETSKKLISLGYSVALVDDNTLMIIHPMIQPVRFWPYSGWWAGKGIGSGRGFKKLLKGLEKAKK